VSDGIALQLATQLYAFQSCTQEQHEEQDANTNSIISGETSTYIVRRLLTLSPSSKAGV
jgi:hypothetical protein